MYAGLRVVPILGERMSSPSSSANHAQWEALVGRAILCFGDIELISIKCLALIPSDKIGDSAARMDFYRRAELLIEILEARPERDANLCNHHSAELLQDVRQTVRDDRNSNDGSRRVQRDL